MKHGLSFLLAASLALAACEDQQITRAARPPSVDAAPSDDPPEDAPDAAAADDASAALDASPPTPPPPACTTAFGSSITPEFGRLDGTVRIVVTPGLPKCKSDDDHVIVQLDLVEGGTTRTYPVLVNILSDIAVSDPAVRLGQTSHALLGPAWSPGWHTGVSLDYPSSLGVHNASFAPKTKTELAAAIAATLPAGAKVSAYMSGFTTLDGGHKVHRNFAGEDGALAVVGTGAPKWLLFHFSQQAF
ncbi:hypothetical protein BH11MYX4_BH11MYX4_27280 [soil metagenome]